MDFLLSTETYIRQRHQIYIGNCAEYSLSMPRHETISLLWQKSHQISPRALSTLPKVVCLTEGVKEGKKETLFCAEGRKSKQLCLAKQWKMLGFG